MSLLSANTLNTIYQIGKDPKAVTLWKNTATLAIKPPMIMLDNTTDQETKNHAALWEFSDRAIAIALQLMVFPLLPIAGKVLAKKVFQYSNKEAIDGTIRFTEFVLGTVFLNTLLVPFYNSKYLTKTINAVSEKLTGKKLMPKQEEEEVRRTKEFNEKLRNFVNDLTGENNKETIKDLNSAESVFNYTQKTFFKAVKAIKSVITYPKILLDKALTNIFSGIYETVSGNNDSNSSENTDSVRDKVYKGVKLITNLVIGGAALALLSKKYGLKAGQYLEKFMKSEAHVSARENLFRLLLAEAMAKPILILMNGDPYMAMRKFVDKIMGISVILATNEPIKKLSKQIGKAHGLTKPERKGLKTALIMGIQVCLLLNVVVTLINNKISGNIFKKLFNDKEEAYQKDFRSKVSLVSISQNSVHQPFFTNLSNFNQQHEQYPFESFIKFTQSKNPQGFSTVA